MRWASPSRQNVQSSLNLRAQDFRSSRSLPGGRWLPAGRHLLEASALAAHLELDNLILFYDSNDVTIDAMAPFTQVRSGSPLRGLWLGSHKIDGHDLRGILRCSRRRSPRLVDLNSFSKTLIGKGIPEICGTHKAHGKARIKYVEVSRKAIGLRRRRFLFPRRRVLISNVKET